MNKKELKKIVLTALALCLLVSFNAVAQQRIQQELKHYVSTAPFKMETPVLPKIPDYQVNISSYGAIGNGHFLNTSAIAEAIHQCVAHGGGTVIVPPGLWLTGPVEMKSNINLHLQRGAILLFSPDHSLYPIIRTDSSSHTWFVQSPIYGYHLHDIAITGNGIMNGSGKSWRPVKKEKMTADQWEDLLQSGGVVSTDGKMWWPSKEAMDGKAFYKKIKKTKGKKAVAKDYLPARDYRRPYMVSLIDCNKILIDGTTFMNSPKFALYPKYCNNVVIRDVKVNNEWFAQNGDGIDLANCTNAIVYKCTVNAGDDGICMKSSRQSSDKTDTACLKNVIIADCIVYHGHGGFVIGSNTDGGMENVSVNNCDFVHTDVGIRVKSGRDRGGLVHNIFIKNIYMTDIRREAILFNTYYEKDKKSSQPKPVTTTTPRFSNFYLDHIYCVGANAAISLTGLPEMPLNQLYFSNINITANKGYSAIDTTNIIMKKVSINNKEYGGQ